MSVARGQSAISREILHREGYYPEESTGLFLGISTFDDHRFTSVRFAVDDAVDLAWVFAIELGLIDTARCFLALAGKPQKVISRRRLEKLLKAGAKRHLPKLTEVYKLTTRLSQTGSSRGMFLLTAATHGLSEQGSDYLVASDTLRERLLKTGIEVKDLFDAASTAVARRRLVLLDACRERLSQGTRAFTDESMSRSFAGAIVRATGLTVLSGSTAGGYSYDDIDKENGVFSGALVEGLLGAAPADERGFITVSTLADFAQARVRSWVARHRRDHLKTSYGIECRFDEFAKLLPLAIASENYLQLETTLRSELTLQFPEYGEKPLPILTSDQSPSVQAELKEPQNAAVQKMQPIVHPKEVHKPVQSVAEPQQPTRASQHSKKSTRKVTRLTGLWAVLFLALAVAMLLSKLLLNQPTVPSRRPGSNVDSAITEEPVPSIPPEPMRPQARKLLRSNRLEPGKLAIDPLGASFRWVPAGIYLIGSPTTDDERFSDETQQQVALQGFWMAETEVTRGIWVKANGGSWTPSCPECPVVGVSWYDAVAFANLVSQQTGVEACYSLSCTGQIGALDFHCSSVKLKKGICAGYRLPTEAEWEVAARAQDADDPTYYPRYDRERSIAWFRDNSGQQVHQVRQLSPNAWGLFDMLGNVQEWTWDGSFGLKSIRGGSSYDSKRSIRAANRNSRLPGSRAISLGFRLASSGQVQHEEPGK